MTSNKTSIEDEIRLLELDSLSAEKWAQDGKIEEWIHKYLLSGRGGKSNPEFSEGLKREKRWWNGPVELSLNDLSPAVGTEPGMEFVVEKDNWSAWTSKLAKSFSNSVSLPPLIAEYRAGKLSVRDGNTRYGAMRLLGWTTCWIVIWYNLESDYRQHNEILFGRKMAYTVCSGQERGWFGLRRVNAKSVFRPLGFPRQIPRLPLTPAVGWHLAQ